MNFRSFINSVGLFGQQVVEFLFWHQTVVVEISSLDHFLEGVIVSELSQILCDSSEVFQGDETWIKATLPVFWLSKVTNTLWISSLDSLVDGLVVIILKNSSNSMSPLPSLSSSAIIWYTAWALASIPSELMATLSSE